MIQSLTKKLPTTPAPSGSKVLAQIPKDSGLAALDKNQMTSADNSAFGFLGISYISFRILGTLLEIRDGLIREINLGDFISYVLFFPTLASGPIDRYRRFLADLKRTLTRQEYTIYLTEGIEALFSWVPL